MVFLTVENRPIFLLAILFVHSSFEGYQENKQENSVYSICSIHETMYSVLKYSLPDKCSEMRLWVEISFMKKSFSCRMFSSQNLYLFWFD